MVKIDSLSSFVNHIILDTETDPTRLINYADKQAEIDKDYTKYIIRNVRMRNFFRGHSKVDYQLIPSIARKDKKGESNFNYEVNMITRAKLRNPNELSSIKSQINLLARLQHYGLETRLLDVTENALIALYFACMSNFEDDGEVVYFKFESESIYNHTMLRPRFYSYFSKVQIENLNDSWIIKGFLADPANSDLISKIGYNDLEYELKQMLEKDNINPVIVEHEIQSEREVRQHAAFLIFPNEYDKKSKCFKKRIKKIDKTSSLVRDVYLIPKDNKSKLLNQLRLFGITDEYIFPEFNNRCKSINQNIKSYYADNSKNSIDMFEIES